MTLFENSISTVPAALALGYFAVHVVVTTVGSVASLLRRMSRRPIASAPAEGISILKPLCGLDAELEENLESYFGLTVECPLQVIFIVDTEADDALPIARAVAARHPNSSTVVVGGRDFPNLKVTALYRGHLKARYPVLWYADANIRATQEHFQGMLDAFAEARRSGPTIVAAPSSAVRGTGIGANMERLHIATYVNLGTELTVLAGRPLAGGKSILIHADDLAAIGGFERFGDCSNEDFTMGMAVRRIGSVAYGSVASQQVVGAYSLERFFSRQKRWARLRANVAWWPFSVLEHWSYLAPSFALATLGLLPMAFFGGALALRAVLDTAMLRVHTGQWPNPVDVLLLPLKELVVFIAYLSGWGGNTFVWNGRRVELRGSGKVGAVTPRTQGPTAEVASFPAVPTTKAET